MNNFTIFIIISIFVIIFIFSKPLNVEHLTIQSDEAIQNIDSLYNNKKIISDKLQIGDKWIVSVGDEWLRFGGPDVGIATGKLLISGEDIKTKINSLQSQIDALANKHEYAVYTRLMNKDAPGNDITNLPNKTIPELQKWCAENPDCKGFNSNGWMKNNIDMRNNSQGTFLYIKTT